MKVKTFWSNVGILCLLSISAHQLTKCSSTAQADEEVAMVIPPDVAYIDSRPRAPTIITREQFRNTVRELGAWDNACMLHFLKHVRVGDELVEYTVARPDDESVVVVIRTNTAYLVFSGPEVAQGCKIIR